MLVSLTQYECEMASLVGVHRQIQSVYKKLPDKHGCDPEDGFKVHVNGACGELALAKALDRHWPGTVDTFKEGADIGTRFQVRTRTKHWHDLIVRPDDRPSHVFVLVIGIPPAFEVVGWIIGDQAPLLGKWKNYGNKGYAWFVERQFLRTFDELKSLTKDAVIHKFGGK